MAGIVRFGEASKGRWTRMSWGRRTAVMLLALVVSLSALWTLRPASAAPDGYSYFPTPSATDGKMLALVALGNTSTLSGSTCTLNFSVPSTQTAFTVGFFDGASNSAWDDANGVCDTSYELYADPSGVGQGTILVDSWTDTEMSANAWSNFSVNNTDTALAPSGRNFYRLTVRTTSLTQTTLNAFKVRVSGTSYVTPLNTFGYMGAVNPAITDTTTYDGNWDFFIRVAQGNTYFSLWDGDFDLSNAYSAPGDTDDANTGSTIPTWSTTAAIAEGVNQGTPADDINTSNRRSPNVYYNVILPDGTTTYTNTDPSGQREWEEFRLDTATSDPNITDYYVPAIPAGLWTIQARGVDLHNLNALRFEYPILGVDADGLPAEPEFPYALGDRVWLDSDRDNVQDSSETSITGVVVSLRDGDGSLVATTTTDADGSYRITSLPGTYTVDVDAAENYVPGGPLAGLTTTGSRRLQAVITDSNIDTLDFGLAPGPALVVSKSLAATQPAVVPVGAEVAFEASVRNVGETTATAIAFTDRIVGAGMEYVTGSTVAVTPAGTSVADPSTPDSSTVIWDLGGATELAPGEEATLTYRLRVKPGTPFGNYPDTITGSGSDESGFPISTDGSAFIAADTDNDDADSASVWVTVPAVEVTKHLSSADATIQAGQTVQFDVDIRNAGDSVITNLPVTDLFAEDDLTFLTATPFMPDVISDGSLSWLDAGGLNPGDTLTLTLTFIADAAPAGNISVDQATAGPTLDVQGLTVPADSDTASVAITRPSLALTKTVISGSSNVDPGDPVSYQVVVRNNGDTSLGAFSVGDMFPSGLVYSSASPMPNVSTLTTYATSANVESGSWSLAGNSLGAPDAVLSTSGNPGFEMRQSFTTPSDASTITAATLSVRSRASGWGASITTPYSDTATLRPTNDVATVGTISGGVGTSVSPWWDDVDEVAASDADFYSADTNNDYALFGFAAPTIPANATNINLTVYWRARDDGGVAGTNNSTARLRVGGNLYTSTNVTPGGAWANYNRSWATNPDSGAAWTAADINGSSGRALQAIGAGTGADGDPDIEISQVYAVVTYDYTVTTVNDDTWGIQYSIDGGAGWSDISAASTANEAGLLDHTVNLTGILTPANIADLRVRVRGQAIGLADGAGVVDWDSSALNLTYSSASASSTSLAWDSVGPLAPGEQTTLTVDFTVAPSANGSLVNTASVGPATDVYGDTAALQTDAAAVYVDG